MRLKYRGVSPECQQIMDEYDDFTGEYHPACCRWPKSCSSGLYEFYPEDDVEVPLRIRVKRIEGIGPGTFADWIAYGYHQNAAETITFLKYFATLDDAHRFIAGMTTWQQLLKDEGIIK